MPADKKTTNQHSESEPSTPEPARADESGSSVSRDAIDAFYDAIRIDGKLKEAVESFSALSLGGDALQIDFRRATRAFMDGMTVRSPRDECRASEDGIAAACHHYDRDAAAHEHGLELAKLEQIGTLGDRVNDWVEAIMVYDDTIEDAKIDLRYAIKNALAAHADAIGDKDSKSREEHLKATLRVNILEQMRNFQTAVNTATQTLTNAATQMLQSRVEDALKAKWTQGEYVDNMALADETFWMSVETIQDARGGIGEVGDNTDGII